MKSKWWATLNAGKKQNIFLYGKNIVSIFFLGFLLINISCDKSDDLETIPSKSPLPTPIESPPDNDSNIIYTDIEPDFSNENLNESYNLDINNDQIIDFVLSSNSDGNYEWLSITSNPNAENGVFSVAPWYTHPIPLKYGEKIFNLQGYRNGEFYDTWGIISIGDCFMGEPDCLYDWKEKEGMYLGLQIQIKGQTHYGWAQLDVTSVSQWVIKDYAYNATPNKPILAGQKK